MSLSRLLRAILAWVILLLFVCLFLFDFTGWRQLALSWEFSPALVGKTLAGIVLVVIAAVTIAGGRVYCSVFCPAGLIQEFFFRLTQRFRRSRLSYVKGLAPYWLLIPLIVCLILGLYPIFNLTDPIARTGSLLAPLGEAWRSWRDGTDNYLGYLGLPGLAFVLGLFFLVVLPMFRGRWFCDRLCLVGAALAALATLSPRRLRLDPQLCVGCQRCERVCPMRCLDSRSAKLDAERCVLCFSCQDICQRQAISYSKPDSPAKRRVFHQSLGLAGTAALVAVRTAWGGRENAFDNHVMPPGADNFANYSRNCLGCQSCVAACPVGIIKPRFPSLRPELDFTLGYCQYNCSLCNHACPTRALKPLDFASKKILRIANTQLDRQKCVVVTKGTACGACAEVCPTHALIMEEWQVGKPTWPVFYPAHCIGCGACRYVCPARPFAFTIDAIERQEIALPRREAVVEKGTETRVEENSDFPF
ncbi:MAG: 4Fe-4S binding protein [Planctomycetota bacterium]|jgi:formate hydrogenlyase subunit 6/NADH:ubiquinone oxidoreductase subunit I|nr:4Fe-4S binding protein [Planctomycetota bacterium]